MRIQAAKIAQMEKRTAAKFRKEPRMLVYVRRSDGSLTVPRAGGFEPIEQAEIEAIDREGGLCVELQYDEETFGNAV